MPASSPVCSGGCGRQALTLLMDSLEVPDGLLLLVAATSIGKLPAPWLNLVLRITRMFLKICNKQHTDLKACIRPGDLPSQLQPAPQNA